MKIYSWLGILFVLTISCITTSPVIADLFGRPDFFEKGREQFEEEIRRFERGESVPNSSLKVDEAALPWSRVVIDQAGFTALLPSWSYYPRSRDSGSCKRKY